MSKTWSSQKAVPTEEAKEIRHDPDAPVVVGAGGPTDAGWHSADAGIWCQKEGQLKHVRGVRVPTLQTPDHFAVGGALHAARACWFGKKFSTAQEDIDDCFVALDQEIEARGASEEARRQTRKYFSEYVEHWGTRPKPRPVAAEYLVGPAPLQIGDQFPLWRTARLDDVSYYPEALGGLAIGEAKTTSASINDCINQYTLHGQVLLQYVLWRNSEQGLRKHGLVTGVVLDIIKKGYGKEKSQFARHFVEITEHAVNWYIKNMREYLRTYANMDWNSDAPRNINACTRIQGKGRSTCEYRDLCMHGRNASAKYVLRNGQPLSTWQPSDTEKTPPWE